MESKIKLNPFTYGKWDVITTLVQLATVVAGIVLALDGNTAGLLALGALAGGGKGTLVGDILKKVAEEMSKPNPKKRSGFIRLPLLVVLITVGLAMVGCGVDKQFVLDSRQAILTQAGDYLMGCQQATIAPAFSVDWNDNVSYGGGVFAGCEVEGRILRFHCEALQDDETGKTRMSCEPLSIWHREESP